MDTWNPAELCRCVGSPILGGTIALLSVGVLFWYTLIGMRWLETAHACSENGKHIFYYLVAIFAVCSLAGYGAPIIAFWAPRTAIVVKITCLIIQNVICPLFLKRAFGYKFDVLGKHEQIGSELTKAVNSVDGLKDRELASLARRLVSASLERTVAVSEGGPHSHE